MAKANDKKVIRAAKELLLSSVSNLLESHRERKFTYKSKAKPLTRKMFCQKTGLEVSTVAYIETGRFLKLTFPQMRAYLATIYGKADSKFATSAKKVYDGLKELDALLSKL